MDSQDRSTLLEGKTVFVADDEEPLLEMLQATLENFGMKVRSSSEATEVYDAVTSHRPDLLIIDVNMPVMSGFQIVDDLRKNSDLTRIPVIFLTGMLDDEEAAGATPTAPPHCRFLAKPMRIATLKQTLEEILSEQ